MLELLLIIKCIEPTIDGTSLVIFLDGTTSSPNPHYCIIPLAQINFLQKLPERIYVTPVNSLMPVPKINGVERLKEYKPSKFIGFPAGNYLKDMTYK